MDLLFGLCCRLPTEQETHLFRGERNVTDLASPGMHHQSDWVAEPALCRNGGSAGAGTLRREAMVRVCGYGLATIQSHFSGFLNKVESALRPCFSELAARSLLRFQAAQGFLTGSQESPS